MPRRGHPIDADQSGIATARASITEAESEPESDIMVGITLSAEQVKNAPPEVRRWVEQEVLAAFGWHVPAAKPSEPHLVDCSPAEAFKIFTAIREMLPVANVFFALGHKGLDTGHGIQAFRVAEIARHAHLSEPQQLVACLDVLNEVLRELRGDTQAVLCGLDDRGYCFVTEESQRSIALVWDEITAVQNLKLREAAPQVAPTSRPTQPAYSPYTAWPAHADAPGVTLSPEQAQVAERASAAS